MSLFDKSVKFGVFALLFSVSTGCMKSTYTTTSMVSGHVVKMKAADEKQKAHFFLFGLAGHPKKDLSKMCPNGIDWVQLKGNVGDMMLSGITLGIWQPRTIGVKCAQGDGGEQ